ncbi:MAG: TRAM domain-containing protein [Candidatus Micrarchaeota archaeon]
MRDSGRDDSGRGFGMNIPKPVKVGDILEVSVEAVASKGDGIAKKDGFVIFIPGAKTGENISVKITNVKRTCAEAERVDAETEAPSDEVVEDTLDTEEPSQEDVSETTDTEPVAAEDDEETSETESVPADDEETKDE